jgi:8-amino-7-oxononanoate synthase
MLYNRIMQKLDDNKSLKLSRNKQTIHHKMNNQLLINDKQLLSFTSNDYLCLSQNYNFIPNLNECVENYGTGSASSALISGFFNVHKNLEDQFCKIFNREASLLFNSGYNANIGILSTLANRDTTIISDKLCHASIIDGIILSRAKHLRYEHDDMESLEKYLSQTTGEKIVITESVFSMEGDICKIDKITVLVKKYGAFLIVDDAHGFGVIGENGMGILDYAKSPDDIDCVVIPLGKSCASMGAVVMSNQIICEALNQFARSYIYTTNIPPIIAHISLQNLQKIIEEKDRIDKLKKIITYFLKKIKETDFQLVSYDLTPIKSIIINGLDKLLCIQNYLHEKGILISAIRYPTVPIGTERLRISLNSEHTEEQVDFLANSLIEAYNA